MPNVPRRRFSRRMRAGGVCSCRGPVARLGSRVSHGVDYSPHEIRQSTASAAMRITRKSFSTMSIPGLFGNPSRQTAAWKIPDERLRRIFTRCQPALATEAQLALTLRTWCGLKKARKIRQQRFASAVAVQDGPRLRDRLLEETFQRDRAI